MEIDALWLMWLFVTCSLLIISCNKLMCDEALRKSYYLLVTWFIFNEMQTLIYLSDK